MPDLFHDMKRKRVGYVSACVFLCVCVCLVMMCLMIAPHEKCLCANSKMIVCFFESFTALWGFTDTVLQGMYTSIL